MSLDHPDGAGLLEEARRTLLETLLPLLPADRRYDALMIANAMAIAGREADMADEAARRMLADLLALPGVVVEAEKSRNPGVRDVVELERRLAQQIRGGAYDAPGAQRDAVLRYLRHATTVRLRISNPKALPA